MKPCVVNLGLTFALCYVLAGGAPAVAVPAEPEAQTVSEAEIPAVKVPVAAKAVNASGSFLSGRFARNIGHYEKAIAYFNQSLIEDPMNESIRGQLLVMNLAEGDMNQAAIHAKALQKIEGHEPIADLVLAVQAIKQKKYDRAQRFIDTIFRDGNTMWNPLFSHWLEIGKGTMKNPLTLPKVAQQERDIPSFVAYHAALINDAAGFDEMAERQYELAILHPESAPFRAIETAADFFRRQGKPERLNQLKKEFTDAQAELDEALDSDASIQMAVLERALDSSQHTPGTKLVGSVDEGVAEVLFTMASVLYTVDAGQDTQLYLHMALSLRPDFPLAELLLGNVQEDLEQYGKAAEVYEGVSKKSPLAKRALLRRAYMVERQGRLEEAVAMLDEYARHFPEDYTPYVAKGDLLRNRARYRQAAYAYTQGLQHIAEKGTNPWAVLFSRGACLERIGYWDEAKQDLEKALALNPNHPEILNYLGYGMLEHEEDIKRGRKLIEKAHILMPDAPHIIDSLGWAYYKTGEMNAAVKLLEKAIELAPGDAAVNDHLGDAYWQVGRRTEAEYQWKRALIFSKDIELENEIETKLAEGLKQVPIRNTIVLKQGEGIDAFISQKEQDSDVAPDPVN